MFSNRDRGNLLEGLHVAVVVGFCSGRRICWAAVRAKEIVHSHRNQICAFCLAIFCVTSPPQLLGQTAASSANLFNFHSGFWVNLHHFLYRQALLLEPQKGPHSLALSQADSDELPRLSSKERNSWNRAVSYYSNFLVRRDLLFDDGLTATKDQLEDAETSVDLATAQIPAELRTVLLEAAPVYRKHWWQAHDAENREWIRHLMPLVSRYGTPLSTKLISIYAQPWPQYPVRVDAVTYANWAGAYTTLHPTRPTISTTDPANQGPAALEILFHETSHGMVDKVRDAISEAERNLNSRPSGKVFHSGSIWHAVLFYTTGELVAEQIPGYIPYADKNGLWVRAWPDPDRSMIDVNWRPHLSGLRGLQPALTKLVDDLAAAP